MTSEEWRPVPGYEGLYSVSSHGRVVAETGRLKGIPKTQGSGKNYPSVGLTRQGRSKVWGVHILVAAAFIGPRPKGLLVCHGDGDKMNNHASNLRYDTASGNARDARIHRQQRAEGRPTSYQLADPADPLCRLVLQRRHIEALARGETLGVMADCYIGDPAPGEVPVAYICPGGRAWETE
jgi:hypothetical protein